MVKLAMASSSSHTIPSVFLDLSDDISNLQAKNKNRTALAGLLEPVHESAHPLRRGLDLIDGRREAATQVTFSARPEGAAGDTGDFLFFKQFHGKVFRGKARRLNARKRIEGTARQMATQPHFVES